MVKTKIAILGASGMLGSMILDFFSKDSVFDLVATIKDNGMRNLNKYPNIEWRLLDVESVNEEKLVVVLSGVQWIIHAIGVIKPYIHDNVSTEVERAVRINSLFPHILAKAAKKLNCKVIQIATDCVYSGNKGPYMEDDAHDALDAYGKTKSIGEVVADNFFHLRCSIIGPELKAHLSLMDWFLGQAKNAEVNGFTNHQWNGVTTLHFSKLCHGIIKNDLVLPHLQHIVPKNKINKSDLLDCFAKEFVRMDIKINPVKAKKIINRILFTKNPDLNLKIWNFAGYDKPPTIEQMISELAEYKN